MTATTTLRLRRGLPRTPGGAPWPPGEAPLAEPTGQEAVAPTVEPEPVSVPRAPLPVGVVLRRGLPRTPGGDPWPAEQATVKHAPAPAPVSLPPVATETRALRRGLPRVPGGGPWPEVTEVAVVASAVPREPAVPEMVVDTPGVTPEARRYGPFTLAQWIGGGVVGLLGVLAVAAALVLGARWFLATGTGGEFLAAYPGEAPLPESAPVGFPAWLAWSHFFNVFLMVLIIRSGLQIRNERRPAAYWAARRGSGRKVSLTVWFHQSLDLLWVINGALFLVLLFATGQWMRIVPTSWEVVPNALSAGLQYLSLDWPTENGWVHYNGLQQLAYFLTVFVAAPLAVLTGVRMSGLWSNRWEKLSRIYPVEAARRLHFPVMIYFVVFIITHVLLVFATGALRNLNHMFAAQGSTDPAAYADNWTGFWLFVLSLAVIAVAWVAARPMVLAPVARLFGTVSAR